MTLNPPKATSNTLRCTQSDEQKIAHCWFGGGKGRTCKHDTLTSPNHRGVSGYIPTWGPITGEPAGTYLRGD
eukprot:6105711-Pyramimonas_sp.AAC.1